jgi:hypothetical protein
MNYEEYTPKNIFSGNVMPVVTDTIILAASQSARELSVIYYDETKKEFFTQGAEGQTADASKAYALSTIDVEAGEVSVEIPVYLTGEFNKSAVVLPEGKLIEDYILPLRKLGIFLK